MTIGPADPRWGTGRSDHRSGYRTRSYYLPDELHFRLRNPWWHTRARGDHDLVLGRRQPAGPVLRSTGALWPVGAGLQGETEVFIWCWMFDIRRR